MKINAMTYNLSWATQINRVLGSEADFVKECQRLYNRGGKQCTDNAIQGIGTLKDIHLMGLQEVNSKIEPKLKKVQPNLQTYERGTYGNSTVSILWDPEIFGKIRYKYVFNLHKTESRPCLMILTDKNFLFINLHSPWETETLSETLSKHLLKKNPISKHMNEQTKIIVMGDFNDDKSLLTKTKPLLIKTNKKRTLRLKHTKSKQQLQSSLRSCCWHELKHKYGHFDSTGDYILTNKHVKQVSMFIPEIFNKKRRNNTMFSDHKPVMSELII
jgi:endonuclease/exonuclease/phosphatase family metal-dependent hydrolase